MALIDSTILNKVLTKLKSYISNAEVKTAQKLKTARTITLSGAVIANSKTFDGSADVTIPVNTIKEGSIAWSSGYGNKPANVGPITTAACDIFHGNRFAFFNPAYITIERSSDAGETWAEVTDIADHKRRLTSTYNASITLVPSSETVTVNNKLRITFEKYSAIYAQIKKILINMTTIGATGCTCKIEGMKYNTDTFETLQTVTVSGWSAWNDINQNITFGNSAASQHKKIRLTFSISGLSSTYSNNLTLMGIYVLGDNMWSFPSCLSRYGHIYSYDYYQNVSFPNKVYAKNLMMTDSDRLTVYTGSTQDTVILNGGDAFGVNATQSTGLSIDDTMEYEEYSPFLDEDYNPLEPIENHNEDNIDE